MVYNFWNDVVVSGACLSVSELQKLIEYTPEDGVMFDLDMELRADKVRTYMHLRVLSVHVLDSCKMQNMCSLFLNLVINRRLSKKNVLCWKRNTHRCRSGSWRVNCNPRPTDCSSLTSRHGMKQRAFCFQTCYGLMVNKVISVVVCDFYGVFGTGTNVSALKR